MPRGDFVTCAAYKLCNKNYDRWCPGLTAGVAGHHEMMKKYNYIIAPNFIKSR